jgi:hypothetical protein
MPILLKVSSQRQVTLPKHLYELIGSPSYFEAELVNKELVLRAGLMMTLAEAEESYGKHGITRDVLKEALKIVARRESGEPG